MKKLISIILTISLSISMASCSGVFANTKPSIKETFFNKIETVKSFFVGEKEPEYATLPRDTDFADPSIYNSPLDYLVNFPFLFTQMTNWNNFYQTYENYFNKDCNFGATHEDDLIFLASMFKNIFKILTNIGLDTLFLFHELEKFPNESRFSSMMFIEKQILPLLLQIPRICWLPLSKFTKEDIEELKKGMKEIFNYWNQV